MLSYKNSDALTRLLHLRGFGGAGRHESGIFVDLGLEALFQSFAPSGDFLQLGRAALSPELFLEFADAGFGGVAGLAL